MTSSYWPFDGIDTTETQYSELFRRLQSDGVWGVPGDTTLKLIQGTGLNPVLKAGYALVRGHMYYNDNDLTLTGLFAAANTSARTDRLCLRLDPTANTIVPYVIGGTAGNPAGNALTQTDAGTYDILLDEVNIGASATSILTADITDKRTFMGHIFGLWTSATRPGTAVGTATPRDGQPGFNTTTRSAEFWDAATTTWIPFLSGSISPSVLSSAVPISKGGTGQITKAAALAALGVWISATDPGGADGDVWFW